MGNEVKSSFFPIVFSESCQIMKVKSSIIVVGPMLLLIWAAFLLDKNFAVACFSHKDPEVLNLAVNSAESAGINPQESTRVSSKGLFIMQVKHYIKQPCVVLLLLSFGSEKYQIC